MGLYVSADGVGVADGVEEEGGGGHGGAGGAAVAAVDDGSEAVERQFAAAYLHERADNGAHHVAQEAVRADLEAPVARGVEWEPSCLRHPADVGLHVGVQLGE